MSNNHPCSLIVWGLIIIVQVIVLTDLKAHQESLESPKSATAINIHQKPPKIDGVLDDDIWGEAPTFS